MKDRGAHPGSTVYKLASWAWACGVAIVAGTLIAFVVGVPPGAWETGETNFFLSSFALLFYFLLLAAGAGAGIAAFLHRAKGTEGMTVGIPEGHPHPGITMHRLKVGGNVGGFIFAIGIVLICLVGLPTLWFFLGLAMMAGLAIALLLRRRKGLKIVTIGSAGNRPL